MKKAAQVQAEAASVATAWVGIDIAKQTFEACLLKGDGKPLPKQFDNSTAGFAQLVRWINGHVPISDTHFCMEATGTYGLALAFFLAEAGHRVNIVNPFRTKHAALSRGVAHKTDRSDAFVIADYCRKENLPLWRAASLEVRTLVALLRRLQTLKDQLHAELPDVEQFSSAQSAAAYAGLAPREHRSDTSIRRPARLSKKGNQHLRRALYMPALSAVRHNPRVKALYARLREKGRPRMVAVAAAMRKLLMIAFGVLKSCQAFFAEPAECAILRAA